MLCDIDKFKKDINLKKVQECRITVHILEMMLGHHSRQQKQLILTLAFYPKITVINLHLEISSKLLTLIKITQGLSMALINKLLT
jgi:hypothetical protein